MESTFKLKALTEQGEWSFSNEWITNYIIEENKDGSFKCSICYDRYLGDDGTVVEQPIWLILPHCHKDEGSVLGYSCDSNDFKDKEDKIVFNIIVPDEEKTDE